MPRVGAVGYLNSRPLTEGLGDVFADVRLDYPSRLATDLAAGELDVALVPIAEVLARCGGRADSATSPCHGCDCLSPYRIVSDACVATSGPVRSVKAVFRRPPAAVRSLAADEGSRTSVVLTRLLLRERFGIDPDITPLPLEARPEEVDADAVLMIGDRAMGPTPGDAGISAVWDLGREWTDWTGLPFVFAVWAARLDRVDDLDRLGHDLSAVRDRGVAKIDDLADRHGPPLGLTAKSAADYLRCNLRFRLGRGERAGLSLFGRLARRAGLLEPAGCPETVACPVAAGRD